MDVVSSLSHRAFSFAVREAGDVGEARRRVLQLAREERFEPTLEGRLAIVATELAQNLVRHGGGGEIVARRLAAPPAAGLEILALDRGPGMTDVARCMTDGFSTGGTPGTGLGAVKRLSAEFDIHSEPGRGTAVLARFWTDPPTDPPRIGALCLPVAGEEVSGDAWAVLDDGPFQRVAVIDGLGHGPGAAAAAQEAVRIFGRHRDRSPAFILEAAHAALRPTRGAAMAVLELDRRGRTIRYAGLGNTAAVAFDATTCRRMVSLDGTVGHQIRQVREFTYPWTPETVLVLHSDGVRPGWQPGEQRGFHPSLLAGLIYRDFGRGRDDTTVLVIPGGA